MPAPFPREPTFTFPSPIGAHQHRLVAGGLSFGSESHTARNIFCRCRIIASIDSTLYSFVRRVADGLFLILLGGIGFLCLRPTSHARELFFIPGGLAQWADSHNSLPHFAAFFAVGLIGFVENLPARWIAGGWCRVARFRLPGVTSNAGGRPRAGMRKLSLSAIAGNAIFLMVIAVFFEIPQIWIPARTATTQDVLAGWGGIAAAGILYLAIHATARLFRPRYFFLEARHANAENPKD